MSKHHFISYSSADASAFALTLADKLAAGPPPLPVWLDKRELSPGRDWDDSIVEALKTCESLLLVMTLDSVESNSVCKREWVRALKYKKPIIPLLTHPEAEMPFQLEPRHYIDFTGDFNQALAQLRNHLVELASPKGKLQALKDRLADAERDLRHEPDPAKRVRIEDDITDLKQQITAQEGIVNNPQGALTRVEVSIASELELERQPARPIGGISRSKFINPPPVVAPNYFQDRSFETKLIGNFLKDDSQRMITVVGRGGIGKTAMVCRLLKSLERGLLPDDGGDLSLDGIVYLTGSGSHRVNVPNIFADLSRLLPNEVAAQLDEIYKSPANGLEAKVQALLEAFPAGRIVLLLVNFEDVIDTETQCLRDRELDEALHILLELPHHAVKVIITTRIAPRDLMLIRPGRQMMLQLDEGLPSPFAENILREMDADGKLGLKSKPDALLAEARDRTRGYPRALEALVSILRSDRDTSLRDILNDTTGMPPDDVIKELIGEAFSRLDTVAQQVMQALAIYGRPVTSTAINYLLQPYLPGLDSTPVLKRLVHMQFVHKEADRYYLHPIDRAYALARVERGSVADRYSVETPRFTQYALLNLAADYFEQLRVARGNWKNIADLAPQLAEFDLRYEGEDYDTAARILNDIGIHYLVLWGHYRLTIEMYERVLDKIKDSDVKSWSMNTLGLAYHNIGRYREAISLFEEALEPFRMTMDSWGERACLAHLGLCYDSLGQTSRAIDYAEEALKVIRRIGDLTGEGGVLGHLGIYYQGLGQARRAKSYHEEALDIAKIIFNRHLEEGESHNLASCYMSLGQIDHAIQLFEQALIINRAETFDRGWEANHLSRLGGCYVELGQTSRAQEFYEEALDIRHEIGERDGEAGEVLGLSVCYLTIGQTSRAIELCEQALSIYREIGMRSGEGVTLGQLGDCSHNLDLIPESLDYYSQALEIARETERRSAESLGLRQLANVFTYEGRYEEAIELALESQQIGEDLDNPYAGSYSSTYLAQTYLFSGDLDSARVSIEAAQRFDIPSNNYKVLALLGVIALRQGDKAQAQEAFTSAIKKADARLIHNPQNYSALDIKGLALSGLCLCDQTAHLPAAIEAFKSARIVNSEAGVVKQLKCLLDALAPQAPEIFPEVWRAAAGIN